MQCLPAENLSAVAMRTVSVRAQKPCCLHIEVQPLRVQEQEQVRVRVQRLRLSWGRDLRSE